jgi:mannose-6-phosphate isomerase-like protein (cupin superfamily)
MAGTADNNGAFDLILVKMKRGNEPPPHVHSREDEFFYVLSGEISVYIDGEVFTVTARECMFLPRRKPHAFRVTSEEVHNICLVVPGVLPPATVKGAPGEPPHLGAVAARHRLLPPLKRSARRLPYQGHAAT